MDAENIQFMSFGAVTELPATIGKKWLVPNSRGTTSLGQGSVHTPWAVDGWSSGPQGPRADSDLLQEGWNVVPTNVIDYSVMYRIAASMARQRCKGTVMMLKDPPLMSHLVANVRLLWQQMGVDKLLEPVSLCFFTTQPTTPPVDLPVHFIQECEIDLALPSMLSFCTKHIFFVQSDRVLDLLIRKCLVQSIFLLGCWETSVWDLHGSEIRDRVKHLTVVDSMHNLVHRCERSILEQDPCGNDLAVLHMELLGTDLSWRHSQDIRKALLERSRLLGSPSLEDDNFRPWMCMVEAGAWQEACSAVPKAAQHWAAQAMSAAAPGNSCILRVLEHALRHSPGNFDRQVMLLVTPEEHSRLQEWAKTKGIAALLAEKGCMLQPPMPRHMGEHRVGRGCLIPVVDSLHDRVLLSLQHWCHTSLILSTTGGSLQQRHPFGPRLQQGDTLLYQEEDLGCWLQPKQVRLRGIQAPIGCAVYVKPDGPDSVQVTWQSQGRVLESQHVPVEDGRVAHSGFGRVDVNGVLNGLLRPPVLVALPALGLQSGDVLTVKSVKCDCVTLQLPRNLPPQTLKATATWDICPNLLKRLCTSEHCHSPEGLLMVSGMTLR